MREYEKLVKVYSPYWWHDEFDYYVLVTVPATGATTMHYVKRKYIQLAQELLGDPVYPETEDLNYNKGKNWRP